MRERQKQEVVVAHKQPPTDMDQAPSSAGSSFNDCELLTKHNLPQIFAPSLTPSGIEEVLISTSAPVKSNTVNSQGLSTKSPIPDHDYGDLSNRITSWREYFKNILDSRLTRIGCATGGLGLAFVCFCGELLQSKFGPDLYPLLTRNGGNAPHCQNMVLWGMALIYPHLPDKPAGSTIGNLKKYFPEILCGSIATLNILGESIFPKLLHPANSPDLADIPLALITTALCYVGIARPISKMAKR